MEVDGGCKTADVHSGGRGSSPLWDCCSAFSANVRFSILNYVIIGINNEYLLSMFYPVLLKTADMGRLQALKPKQSDLDYWTQAPKCAQAPLEHIKSCVLIPKSY